MRVSAGFLVMGLCGNTRIQSFPLRLRWREMATRAASICAPVIEPRVRDCRPNSPKAIVLPRLALPALLPFCILRYLERAGARVAMAGKTVGDRGSGVEDFDSVGHVGVFFADPALDADLAVKGVGLREPVVDVLPEGVQR